MNNEELQSRREFFKKAAKATLPMIAAVALANAPAIVNAECDYCTCAGNCKGACSGGCSTTCYKGCSTSCKDTCNYTCRSTCSGSCNGR